MSTRLESSPPLAEITNWLQHQVNVAEATIEIAALTHVPDTQTAFLRVLDTAVMIVTGIWIFAVFWRLKDGPIVPCTTQFLNWVEKVMKPDDELWRYDTGGDSWEGLVGECGFAILRDGKVVDFWVHFEN